MEIRSEPPNVATRARARWNLAVLALLAGDTERGEQRLAEFQELAATAPRTALLDSLRGRAAALAESGAAPAAVSAADVSVGLSVADPLRDDTFALQDLVAR